MDKTTLIAFALLILIINIVATIVMFCNAKTIGDFTIVTLQSLFVLAIGWLGYKFIGTY